MENIHIDLSVPHLVPVRLKALAKTFFNEISNSKTQSLPPLTYLIYKLMLRAEKTIGNWDDDKVYGPVKNKESRTAINKLWNYAEECPKADIMPSDERNAYDRIEHVVKSSKSIGYRFPLLTKYCKCNNITLIKAIKDCNSDQDADREELLYGLPDNIEIKLEDNIPEGYEKVLSNNSTSHYLQNDKCLTEKEYSKTPVLVIPRQDVARNAERAIQYGYLEHMFSCIAQAEEVSMNKHFQAVFEGDRHVVCADRMCRSGEVVRWYSAGDCLSLAYVMLQAAARKKHNEGNHKPVGGAICVAPFGEYEIPRWNEWGNCAGREIYIFEFSKPIENTYQELLNVASAILHDTNEDMAQHIHFVIMECGTSNNEEIVYSNLSDFAIRAFRAGVQLPRNLGRVFSDALREEDDDGGHYIIYPFLTRKSWTLVTGEEGSGKSWIALGMAAAVASQKSLFLGLQTRKRPRRVLYINDCENDREIINSRKKIFSEMYGKGVNDNLVIRTVKRWNLLEYDEKKGNYPYRDELVNAINLAAQIGTPRRVELLVLDHLLKLTDMEGCNKEQWKELRSWLEDLCEKRDISVLLLHHEYGGGKMSGSRYISFDAISRISLERVPPDESKKNVVQFNLALKKNKGGIEFDYKRLDLNLKKAKWVEVIANPQLDGETDVPLKKIKGDQARIEYIIKLRKKNMTNRQIADHLGCSMSLINRYVRMFNPEDKRKGGRPRVRDTMQD